MSNGVRLHCERGFSHTPEDCLWCERMFVTDAAVITVYALDELIGVICPNHLGDDATARHLEACRRYEQESRQ